MSKLARDELTSHRELTVSRLIQGPAATVFEAFTEVRHLSEWWGPHGFTTTTMEFAFNEGGVWEFTMHGPDGTDYPNWIQWISIRRPSEIVLIHGESPDDQAAFESTIAFVEVAGGTEVTLRTRFQTKEQRDRAVEEFGALEGGEQTLKGLADYVEQVRKGRK